MLKNEINFKVYGLDALMATCKTLKKFKYSYTSQEVDGRFETIFSVLVKRKDTYKFIKKIKKINPEAIVVG